VECLLGDLVRWKAWRFGEEVLGGCYESWADDCASDEQSALNNSYHSVHSVSVIFKGYSGWMGERVWIELTEFSEGDGGDHA